MGVLSRFKLDGGCNSAAARRLLPADGGLIRRAVNVRLRRDNELCQRPGFTALDMGVYGEATATLQAYDLMAYDGRLCALGALSDATAVNGFYEYVGGSEGWRKVLETIPDATNVREVAGSPDRVGAITGASCAARGGYLLVAFTAFTGTSTLHQNFGHLVSASTDQTLVLELLGSQLVANSAVALVTESGAFHVVYLDTGGDDMNVKSIAAATDEAFSSATVLQDADGGVFAAAAVLGSPGGYVTVGVSGADLVLRHYNDSHVQQMTVTISTIDASYLCVHANGPQDDVTIGYIDTSDGLPKVITRVLSTGTAISGPTTLTGVGTGTMLSVRYESTTSSSYHAVVHHASSLVTSTYFVTAAGVVTGGATTFAMNGLSTELAIETDATGGNRYFWGFVWGRNSEHEVQVNCMLQSEAFADFTSGRFPMPLWAKDFGTATLPAQRLGSLTQDATTGLWYSTSLIIGNDFEASYVVTEWQRGVKDRRQSAVLAGQLHVAGGVPLVFDGRQIVEMGFLTAPIESAISDTNGAGSVTPNADYKIQYLAEYLDALNNIHRSPPSLITEWTLGAAPDDTINSTVRYGPTLRNLDRYVSSGFSAVACRTAALADLSAGENLIRELSEKSQSNAGTFTFLLTDDALRTLGETTGVIYTQGQTPIPHQAPLPCRYLWPLNERLAQAGLPRSEQWLASKLRFPGEAIHFADPDFFQFQGAADEGLLGICALGGQPLAFTSRSIQLWQGDGPDHSGSGEFSFAGFVSREGGLIDADGWRSLCETDEGTFFQRSDDQICMVRGGAVEWVGQAIRDELDTYGVVVAAVHLKKQHAVCFALQNTAGNAGELAFYDLRRKQWFLADILATSLAEYQGRLVYTDTAGAAFLQDASEGTGAMPTQTVDTFDFDFGTGQSWGEAQTTGLVGDYRGDATLTLGITFDSGLSFTTIGTWAITAANGYSAGLPFSVEKAIPNRKCARFGLRWQITGSSGSAGLRINEVTLETDTMPGFERRPARDTQ